MLVKAAMCLIGITAVFASEQDECILPAYPDHGTYIVAGEPNAEPANALDTAYLNVSCDPGYYVSGTNFVFCSHGTWSAEMPKCVRSCKLVKDPSITYRCRVSGSATTEECGEFIPAGKAVLPTCSANYYSPGILQAMTCFDGTWDYVARCIPDCGSVTPEKGLGKVTFGEAPWHAAFYTKTFKPYRRICSGSLISTTFIVSVAHCFWNDVERAAESPSKFAAAVGKVMTPWEAEVEKDHAQKSDVQEIKLPIRYQGSLANFQEDIALVKMTSPFQLGQLVRPVCLDFQNNFDIMQLSDGTIGKIPVWDHEHPETALQVVNVAAVTIAKCIAESPVSFREFITADKICLLGEGVEIQRGNSGAGAVFPNMERGATRYYLRGVLSTSPREPPSSYAAYTQILKHEHFLRNFL